MAKAGKKAELGTHKVKIIPTNMEKGISSEMEDYYNTSEAYLEHLAQEKGSDEYNWAGYVRFATRYIKDGDNVLELGCGIGTSAALLANARKIRLTATDISGKFIRFAKAKNRNGRIRFEQQDCTNLTYKDNTFDVVTSMGMLEHVPKPLRAIDEMVRVLKNNGTLIIVFPNWFSWFKILKAMLNFKKHEYFTNTRIGMLPWLLRSAYYFLQKRINPQPVFRKPKLTTRKLQGYHCDEDMVYIAHPFDVRHHLEKKGCVVRKLAADTYRFSFAASLAPYGGIVAVK